MPQFTDVLPASTGALYADSVLCTSLLPYALAVLTCNTVISSASRMELYQARLLASALHVRMLRGRGGVKWGVGGWGVSCFA